MESDAYKKQLSRDVIKALINIPHGKIKINC